MGTDVVSSGVKRS